VSVATGISLEEYLNTSYEPDCDYVDGALEDRNVGQKDHGETQALITGIFLAQRKRLRIRVITELRMRVSKTRIRIPDIAIVEADDRDQVQQNPPLLVIEIVSPDDRFSRIEKVIKDYLAFGVPMIWIIDPYERAAFVVTQENPAREPVEELRWRDVVVPLSEILPE
jgi:Uma2 family endonuclease